MVKRQAIEQLTKESLASEGDERDFRKSPSPEVRADANPQELAKRKILVPRSRVGKNSKDENPFGKATGMGKTFAKFGVNIPFGSAYTSNSPAATTHTFNFTTPNPNLPSDLAKTGPSVPTFSPLNGATNGSSLVEMTSSQSTKNHNYEYFLNLRGLNRSLLSSIDEQLKNDQLSNLSAICQNYIHHLKNIQNDLEGSKNEQDSKESNKPIAPEQKLDVVAQPMDQSAAFGLSTFEIPATQKASKYNFEFSATKVFQSMTETSSQAPQATTNANQGEERGNLDNRTLQYDMFPPSTSVKTDSKNEANGESLYPPVPSSIFSVSATPAESTKLSERSSSVLLASKSEIEQQTAKPLTVSEVPAFETSFAKAVSKVDQIGENITLRDGSNDVAEASVPVKKDFCWTPDKGIKFSSVESQAGLQETSTVATPSFNFKNPLAGKDALGTAPAFTFGKPAATASLGFQFGTSQQLNAFGAQAATNPSIISSSNTESFFGKATDEQTAQSQFEGEEEGNIVEKVEDEPRPMTCEGEEDEETIYQVRGKVRQHYKRKAKNEQGEEHEESGWTDLGVGNVKVNVHKETNKARILCRQDSALAKITLNVRLYPSFEYQVTGAKGKTVAITSPREGGGIDLYNILVKTKEQASELSATLQKRKAGGKGD